MSAARIGPKLGVGREAEVYAWGDDAVVKLYRPGYRGHRAEAAALTELNGRGGAPRLIEVVDHDRRHGLVIQRLPGIDMLTAVQQRPWLLRHLSRRLATTHLRIHEVRPSGAMADLREVMAARIQEAPLPPHLRDFVLPLLKGLPVGDRLCHGDYHPGNVLVEGDRIGVIDWANAARAVPEADHARTLLLLRWADPLPETRPLIRGMLAAGRSLFARTYARAYRRGSPRPLRDVRSWVTVNVAARMSEGIEAEFPKLLRLLERARSTGTP